MVKMIEAHTIQGEFAVKENAVINGNFEGDIIVHDGNSISVFGTIKGNLTICQSANCMVVGSVEGDVINNGGRISIFGEVHGVMQGDLKNIVLLNENDRCK
ncbi:polymer-forming cytoskeletal protein [Chloroflexota bacterium]